MKKISNKLLFFILLLFGLAIMACQKQDTVNLSPTSKTNSITIARTDTKDYKISADTAIAWTTRWRAKNEKELEGKLPTSFLLPINGLQQLQAAAAAHNTPLSGIRLYLSVNAAGQTTVMYVPADINGNDILSYGTEAEFNHPLETYDGAEYCPVLCNLTPNILNSTK